MTQRVVSIDFHQFSSTFINCHRFSSIFIDCQLQSFNNDFRYVCATHWQLSLTYRIFFSSQTVICHCCFSSKCVKITKNLIERVFKTLFEKFGQLKPVICGQYPQNSPL